MRLFSKVSTSLLFCFLFTIISACDKNDNDNDNKSQGAVVDNSITYEISAGCVVNPKKIEGSSQQDVQDKLCSTLKNNDLNGNCGQYQRELLFKSSGCNGWPYPNISGFNSSAQKSYSYSNESCATGSQIFLGSSEASVKDMYCKALKDEERNKNCALDKRTEAAQEAGCR